MAAGAPRMVIATLAAHEGVAAVCERGCGALGDIALRVATRGGSPAWLRARPAQSPAPAFALVVAAPAAGARLRVQVGAAAIEVEPGFDVDLLRAVVAALEATA